MSNTNKNSRYDTTIHSIIDLRKSSVVLWDAMNNETLCINAEMPESIAEICAKWVIPILDENSRDFEYRTMLRRVEAIQRTTSGFRIIYLEHPNAQEISATQEAPFSALLQAVIYRKTLREMFMDGTTLGFPSIQEALQQTLALYEDPRAEQIVTYPDIGQIMEDQTIADILSISRTRD